MSQVELWVFCEGRKYNANCLQHARLTRRRSRHSTGYDPEGWVFNRDYATCPSCAAKAIGEGVAAAAQRRAVAILKGGTYTPRRQSSIKKPSR